MYNNVLLLLFLRFLVFLVFEFGIMGNLLVWYEDILIGYY